MGLYYIREYINNDTAEDIKKISDEIKKYHTLYQDICKAPVGKYSINKILETVEESLNYLEIFSPVIKKWAEEYLDKNRGILWLYYGVEKGTYLIDYWKQSETKHGFLKSTWPFLFNRDDINYKEFIIDLEGAQSEILRQRERQSTTNPNYKLFHPDGCPRGCCCWMLDDMEQWDEEERKEKQESKNIFFNNQLQKDFYPVAIQDLEHLKEQWNYWTPQKGTYKKYNSEITTNPGQTPINLVLSWMKEDFNYSLFSMFDWYDTFENVWTRIDSVEDFIKCQREKLKKIVDLL
jgi:hypothetical protein